MNSKFYRVNGLITPEVFMKKILSIFAAAFLLVTSTFALDLTVGGRIMLGGNFGNENPASNGFIMGPSLYANLDLINGFGLQGEVNLTSSTITTGENSITFTPCEIIDIPLMLWFNNTMERISIGGGAGVNLSLYTNDKYVTSNNNKLNLGFAAGVDLKYLITQNLGLVLGTNVVLDFMPTQQITGNDGSTTIVFGSSNGARKAIYGTLGIEYRLMFF